MKKLLPIILTLLLVCIAAPYASAANVGLRRKTCQSTASMRTETNTTSPAATISSCATLRSF